MDSMEHIKKEFDQISSQKGTRILIWNLRQQSNMVLRSEFDFEADSYDIRIPDDALNSDELKYKKEERQDHIPACDYSLKAYLSILYLRPKMQIYLRGKKVCLILYCTR